MNERQTRLREPNRPGSPLWGSRLRDGHDAPFACFVVRKETGFTTKSTKDTKP